MNIHGHSQELLTGTASPVLGVSFSDWASAMPRELLQLLWTQQCLWIITPEKWLRSGGGGAIRGTKKREETVMYPNRHSWIMVKFPGIAVWCSLHSHPRSGRCKQPGWLVPSTPSRRFWVPQAERKIPFPPETPAPPHPPPSSQPWQVKTELLPRKQDVSFDPEQSCPNTAAKRKACAPSQVRCDQVWAQCTGGKAEHRNCSIACAVLR